MNDMLKKVSVSVLGNAGYKASLMAAHRLEPRFRCSSCGWRIEKEQDKSKCPHCQSEEIEEDPHGLPQGTPIMAVPIHCLPGAPSGWVRDPGSYVVEVDCEHGLWFDWTMNDSFDVAVVPTVKGMNPITGLKTEDVSMHVYREKCPKHDIPFGHNYYCEECGFHWPAQNYVSHPNTLWWDELKTIFN